MRIVNKGLKYIMLFCIMVTILTGFLVLAALIPKSAIKENVRESAEYLCEGELFGMLVDEVQGSKIDRYADSILLAIAYQYDAEHPLESVMESSYYYTDLKNENENLLEAVTQGRKANQQYLRYWHGSNSVVRPLLMFLNIREIYILNGVVLAILIVLLLIMLARHHAAVPLFGVIAGLILTSVWYVPFSLEYTWNYILMLVLSMIGLKIAYMNRWNLSGCLFLLGGMLTNYMDFLTTETLTLLVPLLLITWEDRRSRPNKEWKDVFLDAIRAAVAWGFGYVGMWIMKWIMASAVLKENVMPYVSGHIEERLGTMEGNQLSYIPGSIVRNLSCLFPFEYGIGGIMAGLALIFFAVYIGYVYHKKNICRKAVCFYVAVGMVPYIRYIVLLNHSYLHCFFTYRAQMATIIAIIFLLEELTEGRWLFLWKCEKKKI